MIQKCGENQSLSHGQCDGQDNGWNGMGLRMDQGKKGSLWVHLEEFADLLIAANFRGERLRILTGNLSPEYLQVEIAGERENAPLPFFESLC